MLQRKRQVDEARRRAQTRIEEAKQAPKGLIAWGIQAIASRLPFTITYTGTYSLQETLPRENRRLIL